MRTAYRSIMREESRRAVGLARPLPAMSGAEPWTASNIEASCTDCQSRLRICKARTTHTTDVTRRRETETSNQARAHVGQDITIQVGHDHHPVSVRRGVLGDLQAGTVEKVLVVLDAGEVLRDLAARRQEHTVGHLHDVCLVNSGDALAAARLGVVERILRDTFRGVPSNELDGLDDTVDDLRAYMIFLTCCVLKVTYLVFDTRVLSFSVFTDEDGIDVVVGCLEALNRDARTDIGKKIEGATESQVERDVSLSNCRRKRVSVMLRLHRDEFY